MVKHDVSDNKSVIKPLSRELVCVKQQLSDIHRLNNLSCLTISGVPQISTDKKYDVEIVQRISHHYNID